MSIEHPPSFILFRKRCLLALREYARWDDWVANVTPHLLKHFFVDRAHSSFQNEVSDFARDLIS